MLVTAVVTIVLLSITPARAARSEAGYFLSFDPLHSTSVVGSFFSPKARLTLDDKPVAGQPITFLVRDEKGSLILAKDANTDAAGYAPMPQYTSTDVRTDSITAHTQVGNDPPLDINSRIIRHDWIEKPDELAVSASPKGTSGVVGSTFTVTAEVTVNGREAAGAAVAMQAMMQGEDVVVRSGTTDERGRVSFTYTRDRAGDDAILVTANWKNESEQDRLIRTWTQAQTSVTPPSESPSDETTDTPTDGSTEGPTDRSSDTPSTSLPPTSSSLPSPSITTTPPVSLDAMILLEPDGMVSEIDTEFQVTATLTTGSGDPIPDRTVTFVATMDGHREITRSTTTDDEGGALFTYSRTAAGPDVVRASAIIDGLTAADTIDHRWSAVPVASAPQTVLTIDSPSVTPGSDLTLHGTGCPPGARVDIAIRNDVLMSTRARASGEFSATAAMPDLPLGRYRITVSCGNSFASTTVDLVGLRATTGTAGPAGITSAAVLVFFVLLGGSLLREFGVPGAPPTS
ncbi:MAG: Ig-like domain-containing protein [Kribbellaceae bacterium]